MAMRVLLVACDLLMCASLLVAAAVAVSGGTTVVVGSTTISLHSVGNLLVLTSCLVVARYVLRSRGPLLGISRWPLDDIGGQAVRMLEAASARCRALPPHRALRAVGAVALVGAAIKLANALAHPGFFSGDDVEVQEMAIGAALGQRWPMWELRSAFYPMAFVYPLQAFLTRIGVADPGALILAGRLVVIVLSSAGLIWLYLWARRVYGDVMALVATILLGTSVLHIQFGGSELPRSVSAIFVVAAFFLLRTGMMQGRAALAGLSLAVAACMRFSEVVFFVPAVLHLTIERRYRNAAVLVGAGGVAALAIQGIADAAYWGAPFFSAREMLKFTLVDRLSSRGYEAAWYYLTHITEWTDLLMFVLALAGTRADWRLALWLWLPIAVLSALPHKEPRYLIPSLPFLSLAASAGVLWTLERLRGTAASMQVRHSLAVALVCAFGLRTIFVVSGFHIGRTDAEVALARQIDRRTPATRAALESAWRFGWHLYLVRFAAVDDLTPDDVASPGQLSAALARRPADLVTLSTTTCERLGCADVLAGSGFGEVDYEAGPAAGYRTFERR